MSESIHNPGDIDESLWGPAPSEDEIASAKLEMAERAKRWEDNPPVRPDNYQPHPDGPYLQPPTE